MSAGWGADAQASLITLTYCFCLQKRSLIRHPRDVPALDATPVSALRLFPPFAYAHQPASSFAIKYIQNADRKVGTGNKSRCQSADVHQLENVASCSLNSRPSQGWQSSLNAAFLNYADPEQHQCGFMDSRWEEMPDWDSGRRVHDVWVAGAPV